MSALVLLFPAGLVQGILDDFYLLAAGGAGPGRAEGSHERQACLLQDVPGGQVGGGGLGGYALDAGVGAALADQRA